MTTLQLSIISRLSTPLSTKFKLVSISTHRCSISLIDSRVIRNCLRYVPGESDDDALVFWRQGRYIRICT